jgi:hypothetical protein
MLPICLPRFPSLHFHHGIIVLVHNMFLGFFFFYDSIGKSSARAMITGELPKNNSKNLYKSMFVGINSCWLCMFRIDLDSRMLILTL